MAKSTGGAGWRQKSTGFLATVAAVVLVVVLAGGVAIGYAVEKSRVKNDTTKTTAKKPVAKKPVAAVRIVQTKGTVDATTANSMTIAPKKGPKQRVTLTKTTTFVKASSAAAADIATKARVIFMGAGSYTSASAVMVLPTNAKLGSIVSATTADTMSLRTGKTITKITTKGAKVEKTGAATKADVTKGSKVVVGAVRNKKGVLIATEVIVLPGDSPFA